MRVTSPGLFLLHIHPYPYQVPGQKNFFIEKPKAVSLMGERFRCLFIILIAPG